MANDRAEIIRIDAETVQSVFKETFGVWLNVLAIVDDDGEHFGFYGLIGHPDQNSTPEEKAANIWNSLYVNPPRFFESFAGILVTYMDILNEQKGKPQ